MDYFYVKINKENEDFFDYVMKDEYIDYESTYDPLKFVCDEIAESYIDNCIDKELRPIYKKYENEIADHLYDKINIDDYTTTILSNYVDNIQDNNE